MQLYLRNFLPNFYQRNRFFLSFEVVWSGVFAVVNSFMPIYALRLGATDAEIGLLTSLPGLLTILVSLGAGRFLETRANPTRWTFGSLFLYRAGYLLLPVIPALPFLQERMGTATVILLVVLSTPFLVYNIGIWPFYISAIPSRHRASFFSTQNIINAFVVGSGGVLVGSLLSRFSFPGNYQTLILVGISLSMVSLWCFKQVRISEEPETATQDALQTTNPPVTFTSFRKLLNLRTDYGRVIFNQVLQYIGIWMATPLMTIYIVKTLSASDSWVGLNNSVLFFGQLVGWVFASRLTRRFGEPLTLKLSSQLPVLQPLLMGFSPALTPILFITGLHGLVHPCYSLSHNTTLLRTLPQGKEHQGIAIYNAINRIGVFICPLIGVAAAEWIGNVRLVLILCGLISLVGSLSFHIWPVCKDSWQQKSMT